MEKPLSIDAAIDRERGQIAIPGKLEGLSGLLSAAQDGTLEAAPSQTGSLEANIVRLSSAETARAPAERWSGWFATPQEVMHEAQD